MSRERYVCVKCQESQPEPVICGACGHTDLLDLNLPSERALLENISGRRFRWGAFALLLLALAFLTVGLPYGIDWLAQNLLGLDATMASFLSVGLPCVLFLGIVVVASLKQEAFPDQMRMSPSEKEQWEALLEEPVPPSREEQEQMAKRKAAHRRQRRPQR